MRAANIMISENQGGKEDLNSIYLWLFMDIDQYISCFVYNKNPYANNSLNIFDV